MHHEQSFNSPFFIQEKDLEEVAALEARCFSMPWGVDQYREYLLAAHPVSSAGQDPLPEAVAGQAPLIGLRDDAGDLAAYLCLGLHASSGEMEVYNIAVRPDLRGKRIAENLLRTAFALYGPAGFRRVVLEVRTGNGAALSLYDRLGFVLCGKRKKYYTDTGEDALVLECLL